MASRVLSIGDILMLSQQAWNISRAFTRARTPGFAMVERDVNALSEALKLIAQTLQSDGGPLSDAEPHIVNAVNDILQRAGSMLADLESFVDSYQVIRKRGTDGGFMVERTWDEDVLANYRTVAWTTDGANIMTVQNLLRLHADSIHVTRQALQSESLDTLERIALPIAAVVMEVHTYTGGELDAEIDMIRRQIAAIVSEMASRGPRAPVPLESRSIRSTRVNTMASQQDDNDKTSAELQVLDDLSLGANSYASLKNAETLPHDSVHSTPALAMAQRPLSDSSGHEKLILLPLESSRGIGGSSGARRESTTLPGAFASRDPADAATLGSDGSRTIRSKVSMSSNSQLETFQELNNETTQPPPYVPPDSPHTRRSEAGSFKSKAESISPALASLPAFERLLFRNAAILCDVRGKLVEYARKVPDEVDPRYDTEMVEACKECRVFVIRKRENRPHGGTRVATSIWAISEDGVVRCQQKLSDILETVPYCSYFEHEKVSIPPTEGQISLDFHGQAWGDELEQQVQTNWTNYFLSSENDGSAFQSAVYGRMLMGSFRTTKTTVIHDGLMGTFAFEEQFANIETLRLFQDDGVATPGAQGGVLALMHISSNFGDGWARWWMNCSRQPVKIKAEGIKYARLKGIDISVVKPGQLVTAGDKLRNMSTLGELQKMDTESLAKSAGKRVPVKRVTGIRVEFKEQEERDRFVDMSRRVQSRLIPLPSLGGF